jgi:hypothetical protein
MAAQRTDKAASASRLLCRNRQLHTKRVHQSIDGVPLGLHLAIDHFVETFSVEPSCFSNLGYTLVLDGMSQGHNTDGRVIIFVGIGQVSGQLILARQVISNGLSSFLP